MTVTPSTGDFAIVSYWDAHGHVLTEHRMPRAWVTESLVARTLEWAHAAMVPPPGVIHPGPQLVR